MDTLYIGDIPQEYHYAIFSDNHIDLYNTQVLQGTHDFYRIYQYENQFFYERRTATYTQYNTTIATEIQVTDNFMYRKDYPSIVFLSFTFIIFICILLNLVTSVFKKGGVFSGLL